MKLSQSLLALAVAAALLPLSVPTSAQAMHPTASASAPAPGATAKAQSAAKSPTDWILYEDTTYTPVLDDVSQALADTRAALARKDYPAAAKAMTLAATALEAQSDKAAALDRQRTAADLKQARDTHARLLALGKKLHATAAQIAAGKVPSASALDQTITRADRADLERRWLVSDVTTWYPVVDEPHRHLGMAMEAYAKKEYKAAAAEVRKALAYIRLETSRATGAVQSGLRASENELDSLARGLDKGALKTQQEVSCEFARADHALALAHHAKAAEAWAHKAYDDAGYELRSAAQGLESALSWLSDETRQGAHSAAGQARDVGDKLVAGGVWTRNEVAKGFEALGQGLNTMMRDIGSHNQAKPVDVGR